MEQVAESFERYLESQKPEIPSFHPYFEEAFWEMVTNGGKRFRPKLLFAVVEAYEPLLLRSSFAPALAIEVLHTYSLIHDDLPCMDDAGFRRGHKTLHTKYDETTAVLVGDGLNTYAFYLLANAPLSAEVRIELVNELAFSGGIGGMIIGQALDCFFEGERLGLERVEQIHSNKTARLIAASLKMGGIICRLDEEMLHQLTLFGERLGLLFQINDDILDATASTTELGKDSNNDGDKNSYTNLLGLSGAKEQSAALKKALSEMLEEFDPNLGTTLHSLIGKYL